MRPQCVTAHESGMTEDVTMVQLKLTRSSTFLPHFAHGLA
jgi:hypothetical protein